MSAHPGKVVIDGIVELGGEKVFALQFLQARNPDWVRRPFYAHYDAQATWFDQLRPAFGEDKFFFEDSVPSGRHGVLLPAGLQHAPASSARHDSDLIAATS